MLLTIVLTWAYRVPPKDRTHPVAMHAIGYSAVITWLFGWQ
jgi:hypothetical protein